MTAKAAEWAERVRAWRASGKTAVAFAVEHGIAEATLRWWASELGSTAAAEPRRRGRPPKVASAPLMLARVVRTGGQQALTPSPGAPISIAIGDVRVLVERGVDENALRVVFRALGVAR